MSKTKRRAAVVTAARRHNSTVDQVPSIISTNGEPDYFSAIPERKQLRDMARWLLAHIHDLHWGQRGVYTDYDTAEHEQKLVPLPASKKETVEKFIRREPFFFPKRLTQKLIFRHLLAMPVEHHVNREVIVKPETLYFTGKCSRRMQRCVTLLLIDIDNHKHGTLAGALAFAEALEKRFFPGLYFERSTNGEGVHAYLLVDKIGVDDADYNQVLLRKLQPWLRKWLSYGGHDVEAVEVKGTSPVAEYDETTSKLVEFKFGVLAKLPRDWKRFDDLQRTTRLSVAQLRTLIANNPVPQAAASSNLSHKSLFLPGSTVLEGAFSKESQKSHLEQGWKGRTWQTITGYFQGQANPSGKLNTILAVTARIALHQDYTPANVVTGLKLLCREIPDAAWGCSSALGNWAEVDSRIDRIVDEVENNLYQPNPEQSSAILTEVAKVWMSKGKLILDKATWEQALHYDLADVELPETYAREITYYFGEALPKKHRSKAPQIAVRMAKLSAAKYRECNGISYSYWETFLRDQFGFAPRKRGDLAKLLEQAKALGVIQVAREAAQGRWATVYDVGLRMAGHVGVDAVAHKAGPLTAGDYQRLELVFGGFANDVPLTVLV